MAASIVPNDNDVLFGRGHAVMSHPGNRKLRSLVQKEKEKSPDSNRPGRRTIAEGIVDEIHNAGGRFLMDPDKASTAADQIAEKKWAIVEREKAVDKVMHRLREKEKPKPGAAAATVPEGGTGSLPNHLASQFLLGYGNNALPNNPLFLGLLPSFSMGNSNGNMINLNPALNVAGSMQIPLQSVGMGNHNGNMGNLNPALNVSGSMQIPLQSVGMGGVPLGNPNANSLINLLGLQQQLQPQPQPQQPGAPAHGQLMPQATASSLQSGHLASTTSSLTENAQQHPLVQPMSAHLPAPSSLQNLIPSIGGTSLDDAARTASGAVSVDYPMGSLIHNAGIQQTTSQAKASSVFQSWSSSIGGGGATKTGDPPLGNNLPSGMMQLAAQHPSDPTSNAAAGMLYNDFISGGATQQVVGNTSTGPTMAKEGVVESGPAKGGEGCISLPSPCFPVEDQIALREWMQSASDMPSKEAYITSAVELAFFLARAVSDLKDGGGASVNLRDICAENIVISTQRRILDNGGAKSNAVSSSIRGVKLVAAGSGTSAASMVLQPRSDCAALGRILLDVFSVNRSSSSAVDPLQHDRAKDVIPPLKKSRLAGPTLHTSTSNEAHNLLLELEMPLSICQLVRDLLGVENDPRPSTALTSIHDAMFDLGQMKAYPESFLFDRTCPRRALDDAQLSGCADAHLFGRENELRNLLNAKDRVLAHVKAEGSTDNCASSQHCNFLCEAAFLSGYAGNGKSSLLRSLVSSCLQDQWFVLSCKFDKQAAPQAVLFEAIDDFFGKWSEAVNSIDCDLSPSTILSFRKVCSNIASAVDEDGFDQLSDLIPNLARMFPIVAAKSNKQNQDNGISSMDKAGSAKRRLQELVHVLVESICSAGRPLLIAFDDLQWSDSFVMEWMADFVVGYMYSMSSRGADTTRRGLFICGTYRSNEMQEGDCLIQTINYIKQSRKANATTIAVGDLAKADVTKLLSAKLCLPWRYTRELADLVHNKTRGNPFFIVQFLRTIVSNKMLEFSVRARRWMWDVDVVDMQMISDDVAELLIVSFNELPSQLTNTIKVVSCLGYQVAKAIIDALDSLKEVLPFCMLGQMELAVKEGILERAGPVYQFTHDIVQQTIYELIPSEDRGALHKAIGASLLRSGANNSRVHLLAVDQLNIFCKAGGDPSPEERPLFARSNAQAAKFAIAVSSFVRARSYVDAGIRLLAQDHWETQYDLSLNLFEMSASISFINGDTASMSTCLEAVLSHVMAFEDSLQASSMLAKLLASNSKYDDARGNCLDILSKLGEEFPSELSIPSAVSELSGAKTVLEGITYAGIKALPAMTDKRKLHAMKFLNMLCLYSHQSKPMLVPFLSCRMVMLTLEYGFCEDSIVGIATAGFSMFLFTEDIPLASHLGKVSESLVEESPKKNVLRSRLSFELLSTLKCIEGRWHSVLSLYPEYHNSAMVAGDVENAVICRFLHCAGSFWTGAFNLPSALTHATASIKETAKYEMKMIHYAAMAVHNCCSYLSGNGCAEEVDVKSLDELDTIEGGTNLLVWQIFLSRLTQCFWMRNYSAVAKVSEEYTKKYPSAQQKRILQVLRRFYEGISFLNLARSTADERWKEMGKKEVARIAQYEITMSKWNFENKSLLLQAELHYLDGDLGWAETAYKASIKSAHAHKFIHEEALAYELYGRFCVENNMARRGVELLQVALEKYREWGAMRKVDALQVYINGIADLQ